MDLSSAQHHQEMASQTLESMLVCTKAQQEKKPRPQQEQALKCPRCDSTNTKFCYYNNYSLTQPRYFCKSCRRYWTKGGTLRNVPVGGGCRKNKRSSSSSSSSSSSKRSQDQPHMITPNHHHNPLSNLTPLTYDSTHDLTLAFARLHNQSNGQLGFDHHDLGNPSSMNTSSGFLDALRSGFLETPNGYQNYCYGNLGHVENGGLGVNFGEEMTMVPYEDQVTTTTLKQEYCNGREGDQRVLLGFPWQIGGDGNIMGGSDLDSGREIWNGIGSSSTWHGLLNSPLI